jgi:hypothetical protein
MLRALDALGRSQRRIGPRRLHLPFWRWTLQRLEDSLAELTGLRVFNETVRCELPKAEVALSRPQHKISGPDPEYQVIKDD